MSDHGPTSEAPTPDADGPLVDEPSNPLIVSSEQVYKGKVWNIRSEVFDYNDKEITREFVDTCVQFFEPVVRPTVAHGLAVAA